MITHTAFQKSAFQNNAFQIATAVGSGGWLPYFYLRSREAARRRREREEERKEPALAFTILPTTVRMRMAARPIVTDLSALALRISPPLINDEAELAEFRAFLEMIANMEDM